MSAQELKFYTLLESGRRSETIEFLLHNQTNIVIRIGDKHYKTRILNRKRDYEFSVYKFNFQNFDAESVTCFFEINAEKYFFKSTLTATEQESLLLIPEEIYQLQRRNDFRINVPASMSYTCVVTAINSRPTKLIAEIRDLSLGGCQLEVKAPDFGVHANDELLFRFKVEDFEREVIFCEVKHVNPMPSKSKIQIGVRFVSTDADFLTEMQGLLVRLDRIIRGKGYE